MCIGVQALEDELIEGEDSLTITTTSNNTFDRVSGSSTVVTITDNDGKSVYIAVVIFFYLKAHFYDDPKSLIIS